MIIRWTTPTVVLKVKGADLTGMDVYVTFRQNGSTVTFEDPGLSYDGEDTDVTVPLTQAETAGLRPGTAKVQVNIVHDGQRDATAIKEVCILGNLLDEEL